MLRWFRAQGPCIAAVTLTTYFTALGHVSMAWADVPEPSKYEANTSPSAEGDYSAESKASLEAFLGAQSIGQSPASQSPAGDPSTPSSAPPAVSVPAGANVQATQSVSPQAISLPSGAATVAGMGESFTAQLTTGVSVFNIPFSLPAGRAGLAPSLSLVYASSGGYGIAGVGWSLAGPVAISRQMDRGLPSYDDRADYHPEQDQFIFGGQELVPICTVSGGTCAGALAGEVMPGWSEGWQYFRARMEGAFLRFFWSPDHQTWRIQSKAGINFELGVPLDGSGYALGLQRNPDRTSEIGAWYVVRQYDAHGSPDASPPVPTNLIVYRYFQDGGVPYVSDIFYTPPADAPNLADLGQYAHHIKLAYGSRPDGVSSYRTGWLLEQRLRLTRIDVASKPFIGAATQPRLLSRRFHLDYDPVTHASLLRSVEMEGRCAVPVAEDTNQALPQTSCPRLPSLELEYQRVTSSEAPVADSYGLEFERFSSGVKEVSASPPVSLGSGETLSDLFDINADGLPDVLVTNPTFTDGNHQVFFNRGIQDGSVSFGSSVPMSITGVSGVDAGTLNLGSLNVAALDVDANGIVDLVHMPRAPRYSVFTPEHSGGAWRWRGRAIISASNQDVKINFAQDARRTAVMDVNGDGLVDVVFASATEYQTFFALGRYPGGDAQFGHARWTGIDSADLSNDPVAACTPWSGEPVRLGDPDVRVADLNGDSLPDIVRLRSGQILYWPGRGNGTWGTGPRDACPAGNFAQEQHVAVVNAPRYGTATGGIQFGDVNADGLADLVEVRNDAIDIYLNENGTRFSDRFVLSGVPVRPNASNPVRLTDLNGSGSVDILWGEAHAYKHIDLTGGIRPYLLTKIHNGLGKTTELEYRSSTELMTDAAAAGHPWTSRMPLSTPVVVRSTVRDNLEKVGRPAGHYVTEYTYRDPVFDGRQREFRGFRTAETRTPGDANSPTTIVRSTHLLGECEAAEDGTDVCSPSQRWKDNWREPLKGLPVLTETLNEQGVYLATEHTRYELRQLYTGRDGRRVSATFPVRQDAYRYDTQDFDASAASVSLPEVDVQLSGITQTDSRTITKRATQGTVRIATQSLTDNFGNPVSSTNLGCIEGCAVADESITAHSTVERVPGDTSGWLFRNTAGHVTGSVHTAPRHQTRHEFNARGDLTGSFATLSGTLPLDRFHESSATIAPAPPNASGGSASPIEIQTASYTLDAFGNIIATRGPLGRCASVAFDELYAELPIEDTVFGGGLDVDGCGERAFVTQATYDRGLAHILTATSIAGQPAAFTYDGFGRLLAKTYADPDLPSELALLPAATYEYLLPSDWRVTPYSIVFAHTQDGSTPNHDAYHDSVQYTDGLGRPLITLSEADPQSGDGGDFVAGGLTEYTAKGAPFRAFENRFWSGDPLAFPLDEIVPLRFTEQRFDAFGRAIQAYGLDQTLDLVTEYHALSVDRWDAADLDSAGPHIGSYATARSDGHGRAVETLSRVHAGGVLEERSTLNEYLPTGEVLKITQKRSGSPDIVRWLRYDTLGRVVLNAEPNTSVDFSPNPDTDPSVIKAWRYAYNDAGDLVGTSDARGCGVNYHYDTAGRVLAEDHSPCLDHHTAYSAPNLTTGAGTEAFYRYDLEDPETASIEDAAERTLTVDSTLLWGRLASASDLGMKSIGRVDGLGRVTGTAVRIVKPGTPSTDLSTRYAPRWYLKESLLDAADRPLQTSTGASSPELLDVNEQSLVTAEYTARGVLRQSGSSYGTLLQSQTFDANAQPQTLVFGDAAATQRTFAYDDRMRLHTVQTYRGTPALWSDPGYTTPSVSEPTQQLLLEDYEFAYDRVGNVTAITDWRTPADWPSSAKPVTRTFQYDDDYRLTHTEYDYGGGTDTWTSPFAAENTALPSVANEPKPSPHVDFTERVLEQTYTYDHLGNIKASADNAAGFFDRSLGTVTHGTPALGPHQLLNASNRVSAASSPRKGDLSAAYDAGGNLTDLIVRRDGACLPAGASCWQRFHYEWDELGQISRARRRIVLATLPL